MPFPLSILLRTQNSAAALRTLCPAFPSGAELVVVDHASLDDTLEVAAAQGARVIHVPEGGFTYGRALNAGVAACTGEWIVVMSPHVFPLGEHFWPRLIAELESLPRSVAACQVPLTLSPRAAAQPGVLVLGAADLALTPWRLHGNPFCAYRRSVLESLPFDEALAAAEDADWTLRAVRAGHEIAVTRRLVALYRNRAPHRRYWTKGRNDYLALEAIFGKRSRPSLRETCAVLLKDAALLVTGQIPPWLWTRLAVRRVAELSLLVR